MNKCILITGKRWPPLALVMQMRNCVLGTRGGRGGICLQEGFEPPGSHMLLINGLIDRQQSGVK